MAHENKEPLDIIVFSEVMFDANISGENVRHMDFIRNVAKPVFEDWGYEVKILRAEKTYLDIFHHIMTRPRKHMHHKGMKHGFVANGLCAVKRDCKIRPIEQFYKSIKEPITQYVGICIDEPKRLESLHKDKSKISLLEQYGVTEQMALEKCQKYGLLSPSYELSKRGGCWFCPNAKLAEHRDLRDIDYATWMRFVELENETNLAHDKWNVFTKETLHQREEQLAQGYYYQMNIFDYL